MVYNPPEFWCGNGATSSPRSDRLSRVISTESASKERTLLTRAVVLALKELMRQSEITLLTYDLAAFISMAMKEISDSVEVSVAAWEKRGYWVKADRYRMEWSWSERLGSQMGEALRAENWGGVAVTAAQVMEKLKGVELPKRNTLGTPWDGAWEEFKRTSDR